MKTILTALILVGCGAAESSDAIGTTLLQKEDKAASTKGERGEKGEKGDQGIAGAEGQHGVAGADGSDGANGSNGTNGSAGADGQDGEDALTLNVYRQNGSVIGKFAGVNVSSNAVYVITADKMRLAINPTSFHVPNAQRFFSSAGCTGTTRMLIPLGEFSNVFVNGANDTVTYKVTGNNLGSFSYQSRDTGNGVCSATSGTVSKSYAYSTVTLTGYPFTNFEIEN
ncbi:MAG: hypothetical protein ACRC1W_12910 [Shewanella sp.]